MEPAGFFRRVPLAPQQMRERLTPTSDAIVLCHLGVPRLDREAWSLTIDGLVARPLRLGFSELAAYPRSTITSVHQCAGSPLTPREPTRRVCNVRWSGARLSDILHDSRPAAQATYLWSQGADRGEFGGIAHEAYVKDLPLARAADDVLVAYEINGAPLPAEHGFPARLVVPGFYGTNSVKWLTRMTLASGRADSAFTTRWYNDPIADPAGGNATVPVWSIAPESVIVSPAPGQALPRNAPQEIWGWAWADGGIARVEVNMDGGASWQEAEVEGQVGRTWQRFRMSWHPAAIGKAMLCVRGHGHDGTTQPEADCRNAIHRVEVEVV
jgi:DMSO/TMAO reductase YedYZ molybdopterin-dependent catalytic subunit